MSYSLYNTHPTLPLAHEVINNPAPSRPAYPPLSSLVLNVSLAVNTPPRCCDCLYSFVRWTWLRSALTRSPEIQLHLFDCYITFDCHIHPHSVGCYITPFDWCVRYCTDNRLLHNCLPFHGKRIQEEFPEEAKGVCCRWKASTLSLFFVSSSSI